LQAQVNKELATTLKKGRSVISDARILANLMPELGNLFDEYEFPRGVALQLAQLEKVDQAILWNRLRAFRLRQITAEEMKALRKELEAAREAEANWRELAQKRDETIEETARKVADTRVAEAKREAEKTKREAKEAIEKIREDYQEKKQQLHRQLEEDRRSPLYKFLEKSRGVYELDPEETAETFWLPVPRVAEEIANHAITLGPWLERFGKRLRKRTREEHGSNLKEVR
jgi:flagellar biosynthesis GTPase FlhF